MVHHTSRDDRLRNRFNLGKGSEQIRQRNVKRKKKRNYLVYGTSGNSRLRNRLDLGKGSAQWWNEKTFFQKRGESTTLMSPQNINNILVFS